MNTEQINLVLEIAKSKSITDAARNIFISQPHASYMLSALEKELGYAIFIRSHRGVVPTKEGKIFIQHAHSLNYTLSRIANIAKEEKKYHLSVLSYQYQFAEHAFVKLCEKYVPKSTKSSLFFRYVDNMDVIIAELKSGTCDVAIGICRKDLYHIQKKIFQTQGLIAEEICEMPLSMTVSKVHPLAETLLEDTEERLKYPIISSVGFNEKSEDYISATLGKNTPFVSHSISFGPTQARIDLAKRINGIILSTPYTEEEKIKNNLISHEIPNTELSVFALVSQDRQDDYLIKEYLLYVAEYHNKNSV